jgi:NADH-quinone oxidoreductase subunit L
MLWSEAVSGGPQFFYLAPWIVFFPVIGILLNILFGSRMGEKAIGIVASAAVGLSFIVSLLLTISLVYHPEGETVFLARWIQMGDFEVHWSFLVDTLSVVMMLVVSGVGLLIHIYAIGYMHDDVRFQGDPGRYQRFFVFMNLFIASMMVLVSADNYLMLFVGWEGVGLCSYLLIGFWYDKGGKDGTANSSAANKAFITNRVGDFGMLLAIFLVFWFTGSLNFSQVFENVGTMLPGVLLAVTLLMLVGVAGKSAQIPLYVWLPDAMAGPTPVSALIHAATMVTAGVYLITRSAPLFDIAPQAQNIVALVGAVTALFAATIAVAQFDIKKVLAYSTISQLGFMVAAVGMGAYAAGMFHLVTHAFFKALLFLGSGSVILGLEHSHHHMEHDPHLKKKLKGHASDRAAHSGHFDPQDMRNMGGLRSKMKVTFVVYLAGALALAGIFPFSGFWSKDEILAESIHLQPTAFYLLVIAAFFTAFYMGRQVFMVFFGKPRSPVVEHTHESPAIITVPLMILASLAILAGLLNLPKVYTFTTWLEHTYDKIHPGEFVLWLALLASALSLLGIGIAWWLYMRRYPTMEKLPAAKRPDDPLRPMLKGLFTVLENKYWIDELYWAVILNPYIALSKFLAEVIDWRFWHDWFHDRVIARGYQGISRLLAVQVDLGFIDGIANGLAAVTRRSAGSLRLIQTGYVRNYALAVLLGVVIIIGYLVLR